jgi:hypothetical protein
MNTENHIYSAPEMIVISMESEQCLLTSSSIGGNEELLEDPRDYTDFFE